LDRDQKEPTKPDFLIDPAKAGGAGLEEAHASCSTAKKKKKAKIGENTQYLPPFPKRSEEAKKWG